MKQLTILLFFLLLLGCNGKTNSKKQSNQSNEIEFWLTSPSDNVLFKKQQVDLEFKKGSVNENTIELNPSKTFQTIDGFGNCLNGGSAMHIFKMNAEKRAELLTELFSNEGENIGISYLRISIGASDLDEKVFSYNDLPEGETDVDLENFDLDYDKLYLIPILKQILEINPDLKIMGSPWSAPKWMKTNKDSRGGSLLPEYYESYANYFVKYIQAMADENITIDAITIQNEPLHPGNNPSMYMEEEDQAEFIKNHLGPAFEAAKIQTKIVIYDHNADRPDYPITILDDPDAAKYIDGSAFHLYGGTIDALSQVHEAHPDKNLYFTEQWIGAPGNLSGDLVWHVKTLIIGGTRNWCKNVLEWNMAADPNQKPHTDRGGCTSCLGTITIDGNEVTRNPAYYILAHASKFVLPGSVRIDSNIPEGLHNVAFRTPDGKTVLIVVNDSEKLKEFNIQYEGGIVETAMEKGAVGTFVW